MVEYRNKRVDGTYLWFETHRNIYYKNKGQPEQILFNTRNITQRKQIENELKEKTSFLSTMYGYKPP